MARRHIGNRERYAVLKRCNFACFYCGVPAQLGLAQLEIEHVIPVSQSGGNEPWNLVAACTACNSGKAAESPTPEIVKAAMQLYVDTQDRAPEVRICKTCERPWVPAPDDLEPMDECWPCVFAWVAGRWAGRA